MYHQLIYTSAIVMLKIVELFPHPTYSPDLAPSIFFYHANMKKWLYGKIKKISSEVNGYFPNFKKSYFLENFMRLDKIYQTLKGDDVQK